ncbi:MAG: amidohydrolase family protein [Acetobacteraceae bacterium]|nr:amidohydrolase family protein [Acetobacteraceae bacterium]
MAGRIKITGTTAITMDGPGVIEDCDIVIDGGKIVALGKGVADWAVIALDGRGTIAIPGFVNAHLHLWQPALRGIAADWTLDQYFGRLIGEIVRFYEPRDAFIGNLCGALDQLDAGVTTLFDWCHIVNSPEHADAALDGLRETGSRAVFGYGTPMWLFGTKEPHPPEAAEMRRRRLADDAALVTMALAIRGTDFAPGTAETDIRQARDLGLVASFHVACAKHGPRPQLLTELAARGLLGPDVNLVHANFLEPDEWRAVADAGSTVAITPEVEMQMGLGLPPTGSARACRVRIGLGTDVVTGVGSDMFTQMRFLLQTQRALANKAAHDRERMPERLEMTAHDVLRIATLGGAECYGLAGRTGSLRVGKAADLVLIRRTDLNLAAIRDPVAAVVLHAGVANVDTVIVGGVVQKRGGRLAYRDLSRRIAELEASSARIYGKMR